MKNTTPSIFERQHFGSVRVIMRNGEPWFVANDVATALGYSNPSRSVQDHCKYAELLKTTSGVVLDMPARGLLIIPESDVYALIFRSNLPKAEEFRTWVCEDVLPAIRKTGSYSTGKADKLPSWEKCRARGKNKRRELTDFIRECGDPEPACYARATALLHKGWSDMTPKQHREYKHIGKRNLRDHCTSAELSIIYFTEHMHRTRLEAVGGSTPDDVIQTAKDCMEPAHKIREIFEETCGTTIVSPLNNLPGSEQKAMDWKPQKGIMP